MSAPRTADQIIAAIDAMHPLERERLCGRLSISEVSVFALLQELRARYDDIDDSAVIVAACKRIVDDELEFWREVKESEGSQPGATQ